MRRAPYTAPGDRTTDRSNLRTSEHNNRESVRCTVGSLPSYRYNTPLFPSQPPPQPCRWNTNYQPPPADGAAFLRSLTLPLCGPPAPALLCHCWFLAL